MASSGVLQRGSDSRMHRRLCAERAGLRQQTGSKVDAPRRASRGVILPLALVMIGGAQLLVAPAVAVPDSAAPAAVTEQPADAAFKVLVLGDSISAGYGIQRDESWVTLLQTRLRARDPEARVVNASVSGETTGGGLARLPKALQAHDPDVVVIELGGNDGLRGYPIRSIRENLAKLIGLSRASGAAVLLVGMQIPPNYGPRYTGAFRDVFPSVAEREAVPLVPFLMEQVALVPGMMQSDGIHPTAAGQPLMLDTVWPYLEPLLSDGAASGPR